MSKDNKERLKFWVTCPQCGKKFGVSSNTVFKYVDRLMKDVTGKFDKAVKDYKEGAEEEGS